MRLKVKAYTASVIMKAFDKKTSPNSWLNKQLKNDKLVFMLCTGDIIELFSGATEEEIRKYFERYCEKYDIYDENEKLYPLKRIKKETDL
jgi:hypothetical protein